MPPPHATRRGYVGLLACTAAASITGCSALADPDPPTGDVGTIPVLSLEMDSVTDYGVAERVTYEPMGADERGLAREAIRDGPVRRTARGRPFPENRPFVFDDEVWELSDEVVETTSATVFRLTLSETDGDASDAETISYSALSATDRENLERYGWHDGGPFVAANVVVTYRDAVEDSGLVPQPDAPVLTWESGETARITVAGGDTAELETHEYTAERVHESAPEFGRSIREDAVFRLDDLSEEQADVVSEAITAEHGYQIDDGEPPSAARELAERIGAHERVDRVHGTDHDEPSTSGSYVVRHEGELYWTELSVRRNSEWI